MDKPLDGALACVYGLHQIYGPVIVYLAVIGEMHGFGAAGAVNDMGDSLNRRTKGNGIGDRADPCFHGRDVPLDKVFVARSAK